MRTIKKINEFSINENIEWIFKEPKYIDKVGSSLLSIIMNENGISEKSFKLVDEKIEYVDELFKLNSEIRDMINEFEEKSKRVDYCAEYIFDKYIKNSK